MGQQEHRNGGGQVSWFSTPHHRHIPHFPVTLRVPHWVSICGCPSRLPLHHAIHICSLFALWSQPISQIPLICRVMGKLCINQGWATLSSPQGFYSPMGRKEEHFHL